MTKAEQLALTAIHEAGHAVCDVLHGFKLWCVTIRPHLGVAGRCLFYPLIPVERLRDKVRGICAGYVAETLFYPNDADHETAETDFGEAERVLSVLFTDQDLTNEAWAVYEETADLLSTEGNIRAIRLVADALLQHTTITGGRVMELVSQARADVHGKAGGQ